MKAQLALFVAAVALDALTEDGDGRYSTMVLFTLWLKGANL